MLPESRAAYNLFTTGHASIGLAVRDQKLPRTPTATWVPKRSSQFT
jgi:hypothetical protein